MTYKGHIDVTAGGFIKGWCCKLNGEKCFVHLKINGLLKAIYPADQSRKDLTAAGISKFGGFQFDISSFLPVSGEVDVEITDETGKVLPNGAFNISTDNLVKLPVRKNVGDLSGKNIGVYGNYLYAVDIARGSALSKILSTLGIKTLDNQSGDLNIWFCHPYNKKPMGVNILNGRFEDASKSSIDVAHREIFGRSVCMTPAEIKAGGLYVIKSETQAAHDGEIKLGAHISKSDFQDKVVQRLINNCIDDDHVQDIRIPYIGGEIPFAYIKNRSIKRRFSNENKSAYITNVGNVLSSFEVVLIERYCKELHLDYGEIDILRDSTDGKIWIVDINNTPSGPPNGLTRGEINLAIREMALSFYRSFLKS